MSYQSPYAPLRGGIAGLTPGGPTTPLIRGLAGQIPGLAPPLSTGAFPLNGGNLGIGPTGLPPSLAGQIGGVSPTQLPYAQGVGQQLMGAGAGFNPGGLSMMGKGGLVRSVAGRGSLGATAGMIGSNLIDATNIGGQNSNAEQGLQGAAYGAGIGAAIGAPLFGVGAVPGALIGGGIGGAIGVLGNIFGGGDEEAADPIEAGENVLATAIQQAGLDPHTTAQILDMYEIQLTFASAEEDEAVRAQLQDAALQQAGQMVLQAVSQRQQMGGMMGGAGGGMSGPDMLALQQQAAQTFEPLARDIETSGMLYADAMSGIRDQLPESYRAIADATTARELSSSNQLADAYRAQAAITPTVNALTQYQQDFQSYAAQLFAQQQAQMAAQMSSGGMGGYGMGGGQQDISALLQPQG